MAAFAEPSSATYAYGSSGIGKDRQVQLYAKITRNGLKAQALSSARGNPSQSGLGRT